MKQVRSSSALPQALYNALNAFYRSPILTIKLRRTNLAKNLSENATDKIFILVLSCFFLSGFSGLIYEILWTKMTVKIIGSAPYAVCIILTIFMGGLGLGSHLAGRFIDRVKAPQQLVRIYGILELLIGFFAILVPLLINVFKPLQAVLYNELYSSFFLYNFLTFIICSVILCVPVICMGATLPILSKFYVARLSHLGAHAGKLYGLNTIGAALGALVCGFWLIDIWGVYGTLAFALAINFAIGALCIKVSYRFKMPYSGPSHKVEDSKKTPEDKTAGVYSDDQFEAKSALVIFMVSGFCAMACEVIWTRILGLIVGPTSYSFTIVLVTFITGLALGSMIFGYFADKVKKPIWLLLFTQITAALLVLTVSQLIGSSQLFFAKLIFSFKDQFWLLSLSKTVILFLFMILPTLCFGATFPLVGKIYTKSVSTVGKSIGFAYMLNSVGSLSGSFFAGFLLIPLAGKELGLCLVVCLQIITSLIIAAILLKNKRVRIMKFAPLAALSMAGLFMCFHYPAWDRFQLSSGKYHRFEDLQAEIQCTGWLKSLFYGTKSLSKPESTELVYYGDGIGGFTTVLESSDAFRNFDYLLYNSGKPDASVRLDMMTQTLLAHFPMLFHKDPRTVMILGLASGITAGETLYYPVEQLDVLEISNQVVAASDFFIPWNNKVLSDSRTNLILQDARAHLQLTKQNYDVIISEPSNPWMAGLAALFTEDFFSSAQERLNDDGIFVQFMHIYQMDWSTFALVGRTFTHVFPNSLLVMTSPGGGDFLMVGFKGNKKLTLENATPEKLIHANKSKNVTIANPRLLYRLIVSEDLGTVFGKGVTNTDNWPRLEFAAPKLMFLEDERLLINLKKAKQTTLSSHTRNIIEQIESSVDDQIDFAAYSFSIFQPFKNMVDLSRATPSQKRHYYELVERYCEVNPIDLFLFNDNELKNRCLSIQIDAIKNKIELSSKNALAYSYLANLYDIKGMLSESARYYTQALKINPHSADVHNKLGIILARQNKIIEAIEHFTKSLTIEPNMEANANLGQLFTIQGKLTEAAAYYSEALKINPESVRVNIYLGDILRRQEKIQEAITHYSKAVELKPDNKKVLDSLGEAHFAMGEKLLGEGRTDRAITHLQKALQINGNHATTHMYIGYALLGLNKDNDAITYLQKAISLDPEKSIDAYYNLACIYAKKNKINESVNWLKKAIDKGFNDWNTLKTDKDLANIRNSPYYKNLMLLAEEFHKKN